MEMTETSFHKEFPFYEGCMVFFLDLGILFFGPVRVLRTWPDFFVGPGGTKTVGDLPVRFLGPFFFLVDLHGFLPGPVFFLDSYIDSF